MPLVKKVRTRGANMVIVANGELLFLPGGDISRWNRVLSNRIRNAAARAAPSNKRPRWAHYGKPLKQTMRASTDLDASAMMAHAVVGSTAHYSAFVDQGTGVFVGGSPWQAKTLPPWKARGYRFYEPGVSKNRPPVMIEGQKGQFFLDEGVEEGFRSMRIPVGTSVRSRALVGRALGMFPDRLAGFMGNTPVDEAFKAQRDLWRAERDEAWKAERERRSLAAENRYREKKAQVAAAKAQAQADAETFEVANRLAAYEASKAAAARRAKAQTAKLKAQRDRTAEAERIREEKAAQTREADRLMRGNAEMRREAMDFFNRIRQMYPNAQWAAPHKLDDGVIVYRVVYTTESGETVRQRWAYGYAT